MQPQDLTFTGAAQTDGHATFSGQTIRGTGTNTGGTFTVAVTGTSTVSVMGVHTKQPKSVGCWTVTVRVTGTMIVCDTAQVTTLRAWPGVRNETAEQSMLMFPTGIRQSS
ncbi:MAG TPA: hypothetical protein VNT01_00990 [Symbiobacteriaceae bacterium]|nr:hypothetical protein [Symbiobacteriaceae bacterium]